MVRLSKDFCLKHLANASLRFFGTSKTRVVPAQAGTQSLQVFEYTKDWIPAFAGMTNI